MNKEEWVSWETTHWKPILNYTPTISLLANRWLVIVFIKDLDASRILNSLWTIGNGSLVLNRWHANFNPLKERVIKRHLWVLMSALPFSLWKKDFLIGIANIIGKFVVLEKEFNLIFEKRMAGVLVIKIFEIPLSVVSRGLLH